MTDRLDKIRKRLEAATPGPWTCVEGDSILKLYTNYKEGSGTRLGDIGTQPYWKKFTEQDKSNAELIAHAPEDIAYLLAEVERLNVRLDKWNNLAESAD